MLPCLWTLLRLLQEISKLVVKRVINPEPHCCRWPGMMARGSTLGIQVNRGTVQWMIPQVEERCSQSHHMIEFLGKVLKLSCWLVMYVLCMLCMTPYHNVGNMNDYVFRFYFDVCLEAIVHRHIWKYVWRYILNIYNLSFAICIRSAFDVSTVFAVCASFMQACLTINAPVHALLFALVFTLCLLFKEVLQ